MQYQYTKQAEERFTRRNLSHEAVDYIILNGCEVHKAGAVIHFLRRRDVPTEDRAIDQFMRLVGTAVVCSPDDRVVITAWRNREKGLRNIRRKPDYSRSPRAAASH